MIAPVFLFNLLDPLPPGDVARAWPSFRSRMPAGCDRCALRPCPVYLGGRAALFHLPPTSASFPWLSI
eukprot:4063755-Pyramimonas_sp.AAC.1